MHDQEELDNVSLAVIRDFKDDPFNEERLKKLVQRAARHYSELLADQLSNKLVEKIYECADLKIKLAELMEAKQ